ncbi:hypothetical protein GOP47_0013740 [Adiantum capillus-veneris]|uniref:Uncharacterized protein n=1 Tax=Adiantum capillus-veneris TaxID=13818 RepID=A0A9D4UPL7_ADICA|nr:hypothetical protein GOP47_0013740 [Adiantum capillus-veneris]
MLRAYRAITSSCRYTGCGHGERAWRYSTFSGDLQEYEALASNVSSALAGSAYDWKFRFSLRSLHSAKPNRRALRAIEAGIECGRPPQFMASSKAGLLKLAINIDNFFQVTSCQKIDSWPDFRWVSGVDFEQRR